MPTTILGRPVHWATRVRVLETLPDAKEIQQSDMNSQLLIDGVRVDRYTLKPVKPMVGRYAQATLDRFPDAKEVKAAPGANGYLIVDGVRVNRSTGKPAGKKQRGLKGEVSAITRAKVLTRYPEAQEIHPAVGMTGYLDVDGVKVRRDTLNPMRGNFKVKVGGGTHAIYAVTRARFPEAKSITSDPASNGFLIVDGVRVNRKTGKPAMNQSNIDHALLNAAGDPIFDPDTARAEADALYAKHLAEGTLPEVKRAPVVDKSVRQPYVRDGEHVRTPAELAAERERAAARGPLAQGEPVSGIDTREGSIADRPRHGDDDMRVAPLHDLLAERAGGDVDVVPSAAIRVNVKRRLLPVRTVAWIGVGAGTLALAIEAARGILGL